MKLEHKFFKQYKLDLTNISTLKDFSNLIVRESLKHFPVSMIKTTKREWDTNEDHRNEYLGAAFEAFIECLIKCNPTMWVDKYTPNDEFDKGVDGWGVGMNGEPATIQIKFRSNPAQDITQDVLYSFILYSWGNPDNPERRVNIDDTKNMFVFTNCKGIDYRLASHVGDKVVAVCAKDIKWFVDGKPIFWKEFAESF